ncbi:MAG: PDZ domain-containing protein [Rubripirellula sp.]
MSVCKTIIALMLSVTVVGRACADDADQLRAAYQQAMAKAVRTAAEHVLPSVVMIEIVGTSQGSQGEIEQDAPTSGVIVAVEPEKSSGDQSRKAYVIAASLVVAKPAASILVVLGDGTRNSAKVIAKDDHRDLVLLEFKTDQALTAVSLTSKARRQIGQTTIAIGRYGSNAAPIVSTGILSGEGRLDGIALQTDARVSASHYGAPLIDLYGNLLGILIPAVAEGGAETATDWYDSGVAFAIPADAIAKKLDRLKAGKDIKKGLLGIVGKSKDLNDANTEIAAVRTRSPAEEAGIKAGDQVLAVDGIPVKRHQEIRQVLGSFDAGEVVNVKLDRDGKPLDIDVTLAETIPPLEPQRLGLIITDENEQAVASEIIPESPASESLKPGDVVLKINETKIDGADALRRQMIAAQPDKELLITYRRGKEDKQAKITPETIAGKFRNQVPPTWNRDKVEPWVTTEIKLPESPNVAFYVAPDAKDKTWQDLGLLVLLLGPGDGAPESTADQWKTAAEECGVVVCVIAPEDATKWQPKELEVTANFASAIIKKANVNVTAVAVASVGGIDGADATAADTMALAAAISQSKTFFGVAVSPDAKPPAVRLRENEPAASLQLMIPAESATELPDWSKAIEAAGYPVIVGGKLDQNELLNWVRLLQAI